MASTRHDMSPLALLTFWLRIHPKRTAPSTIHRRCSMVPVPTNFHFILLTLTHHLTGWQESRFKQFIPPSVSNKQNCTCLCHRLQLRMSSLFLKSGLWTYEAWQLNTNWTHLEAFKLKQKNSPVSKVCHINTPIISHTALEMLFA